MAHFLMLGQDLRQDWATTVPAMGDLEDGWKVTRD
jgi:hypothetical protein